MRKITVSLFILCILVVPFMSFGAPCYGTKMPDAGQLFAGGQTHVIFDKKLKNSYGTIRSLQHFLLLSYGVFDWLSIDLKGGAGNIKQNPTSGAEVDYPSSFDGGYGLRVRLYEEDNMKVAFGFQHISVHPQKIHLEEVKNTAVLDDWQVSLLASYDFSKITPYIGVRWSRIDYIHWIGENRKRKMSDSSKPIGLVTGFDFYFTEKTWLNLEGQFLDGEAAALSLNCSF